MNPRHSLIKDVLCHLDNKLFDELTLTSTTTRQFAIRIAQGVICRENVMVDRHEVTIFGATGARHGSRVAMLTSGDMLAREILSLHQDLLNQKPDSEYVPMTPPAGKFRWHLKERSFRELLTPEKLYPIIERHVRPIRERGLRVTGYIEINEKDEFESHVSGFELETLDYGATMTFTVDLEQKATGVGKRSTPIAGLGDIDHLIGDALLEATDGCVMNREPASLIAGDYTVIFSPSCVYNLISSCLGYGFFDRRKIDEGRTFLSGKWRELNFPEGLRLMGQSSVAIDEKTHYSLPPFNRRRTHCSPMNIIQSGKIQDLHTGSFWARKQGLAETHSPYSCINSLTTDPQSPMNGKWGTIQDLIKDTPKGIFVADLWYLRMVAEMDGVMTGMTRDGVFEISNGQITRPLKNMRWHDNPVRVLQAITGITSEKRVMGLSPLAGDAWDLMCYVPAIRVEKFHFSSETKF